ncbi:AMP-dependent synthetase/ligase [Treponema brennaborense]|uniref:Long-chain-fatty-acid--CoA ligase., 4-coumarate--CoA ligase n=1 Tax=Treponema brennaborense (strain DSM 12168 / CIP 105900 / DD5/3) TaxID=906968 RepID=F4LJL3_TREBD|nr:long-chain fatty acid--CoA ligase [Treponema brennaborense]AEE16408.1 Long-chain-fatty-acid--CoA ligase., 4-coumarate--CoA ligase [Treponema brennaborense DSM 12168]
MAVKKSGIDTSVGKNLPLLLRSRVVSCPDTVLQASKNSAGVFELFSYKQVYEKVIEFAHALKEFGIVRGDAVALISDNRREWFITDMALLSLGAADVPRGCDSMGSEIRFIISYAECRTGFFETERQLCKVLEKREEVPLLENAILFEPVSAETAVRAQESGIRVFSFAELEAKGARASDAERTAIEAEMDKTSPDEIATIIFTSGTTGVPKGVMLTHDNFIAQVEVVKSVLTNTEDGDLWLSVLPVWHSFERVFQYLVMGLNSGLAYSKPVAAVMLADMATLRPQAMCGVPRLWESLAQGVFRTMRKTGGVPYKLFLFFISVGKKFSWAREHVRGLVCRLHRRSRILDALVGILPLILLSPLYALGNLLVYRKIRAKLGGRMECAISGGGALQSETDAFYRAIGFKLLEGYGITEAAPVLSVRWPSKPRSGCVGQVYPCAQIKVVAEEHGRIVSGEPLPPGKSGLVLARGRQIMKGYYKRPDLTEQVVDKDGWLNTGDLGVLSYDNEIKITGRAKDTIVLLGGENIEPLVIESALCGSPYIESAVIQGQDKKYLGALIVPVKEAILTFAQERQLPAEPYGALLESLPIVNLIRDEIDRCINAGTGFRMCERIYRFVLLSDSFTVGRELSGKQEMMRHKIAELYKKQIDSLFD